MSLVAMKPKIITTIYSFQLILCFSSQDQIITGNKCLQVTSDRLQTKAAYQQPVLYQLVYKININAGRTMWSNSTLVIPSVGPSRVPL